MVFTHVEELKRQYTDKYVVVDDQRPELHRFRGQTGQVKTVNMSGRALVEFDAHENVGWFDIELDFLKVVDRPPPKKEKPKSKPAKPAKPAAKSPAKPAAKSAGKPVAKPKGAAMSVEEMLAKARSEKSGGSATVPKAKPPAPVAASDPKKKLSVEDMLAAARAEKSGKATTAPVAHSEPAAPTTPVPESTPEAAAPKTSGALPTDTEGIVAYCQQTDASS